MCFEFTCDFFLNFELLDILWSSTKHPSQKLWPLQFVRGFLVQFQASRYIMGFNQTSESKFMAIWIYQGIPCWILSISIYCGLQLDIRVKSYGWWNLVGTTLSTFKRVDILWISIGHLSQKLWLLEFAQVFLIKFWASQYIMGLNWTSKSKVMTVWIWEGLPSNITSISIYYEPQVGICVKS